MLRDTRLRDQSHKTNRLDHHRGEDRYGHFDLVAPPGGERDPAALAAHQEVSDRYRENDRQQVERHEQRLASAG